MNWDEMALVGRIARAHGIRGQVVVNPETDFPDARFRPGAELFIERNGRVQALRLTSVRFQHDRPVIGIEGVETIDDAEQFAGCELRVPVADLAQLPQGTFYRHDLIGCRVETGAGDAIGVVNDVEGTLGGSRLIVNGAGGEIQIPLATEICTTIDVERKRIVVNAPEGLLDLNA
jgi:16S rRNA processing protein RimM